MQGEELIPVFRAEVSKAIDHHVYDLTDLNFIPESSRKTDVYSEVIFFRGKFLCERIRRCSHAHARDQEIDRQQVILLPELGFNRFRFFLSGGNQEEVHTAKIKLNFLSTAWFKIRDQNE